MMFTQLKKLGVLFNGRDMVHFAGLLLLMLLASLLEVLGIGAIPAFVAALAAPEQLVTYPGVDAALAYMGISPGRELVFWGAGLLIGVFLFKTAFLVFTYYVQARATEKYRVRLSDRLFSSYMYAPYEFVLGRNTSELLRNVNNETKVILDGVLYPLLTAVMGLLMTLFVVIFLVLVTPGAALLAALAAGGGSWLLLKLSRDRLRKVGEEAQRERRMGIQAVTQGLGAFVDARILHREGFFTSVFRETAVGGAVANRTYQMLSRSINPALEAISVGAMLLAVLVLLSKDENPSSLVPVLALLGAAVVRLKGTVSATASALMQMRFSIAAIDPIYEDMIRLAPRSAETRESRRDVRSTGESKLPFRNVISLEQVTYQYPEAKRPSLEDVTLRIQKGTSVAFVGATGSGKSTLANVLLGLLKPQGGRITVDGANIHHSLRSWHKNIGYIPQNIYLLDDTIRRNIAFGLPPEEVDEDKLHTAIRAAQLEGVIGSLEHGVDTMVGERGVRLSGGQRQRVGMARALYHDPDVLIMDEATSALDNQTEGLVMSALETLKQDRTFIMIAHRLSTVRQCDQIFLMSDGRLVDCGRYDQLVASNSYFQEVARVG